MKKMKKNCQKLKIQNEDKVRKENFTDALINAFVVKRRKAMIDQEDIEEDNVDYETSVRRLYVFAITLAIFLVCLATLLTSILSEKWFKTSTIIIQKSPLKRESQLHSVPHLVLLINDGSMEIYEFGSDNAKINHVWSFKVPHQKEEEDPNAPVGTVTRYNYPGYTLSISKEEILIFYMGGNKDTTVLTRNEKKSNLTHQTIKQSKVPQNMLTDSRFTQAGNQIWIIGGINDHIIVSRHWSFLGDYCNYDDRIMKRVPRQTLIWNLERQTYYPGPKLPTNALDKGCPITLNRTYALILYVNQNCLDAWMYSFEEFQWTHLKECFYESSNSSHLQFDLMCASYLDKYMNRKVLVGLKAVNKLTCYSESFDLLLIDLERKVVSIISQNLSIESRKFCNILKIS